MKLRLMGLLLALLPMAWWAWSLRDPCGVTGEAWRECRAHHFIPADAPVPQPERDHSTHHTE